MEAEVEEVYENLTGEQRREALSHHIARSRNMEFEDELGGWFSPAHFLFGRAIAAVIHKELGSLEALHVAVENGPVWAGDWPSKSERDTLTALGVLVQIIVKGEDGFHACNYEGLFLYNCWAGKEALDRSKDFDEEKIKEGLEVLESKMGDLFPDYQEAVLRYGLGLLEEVGYVPSE